MSACCRPSSHGAAPSRFRQWCSGFTLIEILVVLVIAALATGLIAPRISGLLAAIERRHLRQSLAAQLADLPYRCWIEGQSRVLDNAHLDALALGLPAGWRLEIPRPIRYAHNGFCAGGTLILKGPDAWEETWQLRPPRCDEVPPADA